MFLLFFYSFVTLTFGANIEDLDEKIEVKKDHVVGRIDLLDSTYSVNAWLNLESVTKNTKILHLESEPGGKDPSVMVFCLIVTRKRALKLKVTINKSIKKKTVGKIKFNRPYYIKVGQKIIDDQV